MINQLSYKDYIGSVVFSEEDGVFHGRVLGVSPSITFEGDSVKTLIEDFHNAVDEYLEYCSQANIQPETSTFSIQISAEAYGKLAMSAIKLGIPVSKYIEKTIEEASIFA